jgi:hypothetical protein
MKIHLMLLIAVTQFQDFSFLFYCKKEKKKCEGGILSFVV